MTLFSFIARVRLGERMSVKSVENIPFRNKCFFFLPRFVLNYYCHTTFSRARNVISGIRVSDRWRINKRVLRFDNEIRPRVDTNNSSKYANAAPSRGAPADARPRSNCVVFAPPPPPPPRPCYRSPLGWRYGGGCWERVRGWLVRGTRLTWFLEDVTLRADNIFSKLVSRYAPPRAPKFVDPTFKFPETPTRAGRLPCCSYPISLAPPPPVRMYQTPSVAKFASGVVVPHDVCYVREYVRLYVYMCVCVCVCVYVHV